MSFLEYYNKLTSLNRALGVEFAFRHPFDGNNRMRKLIALIYIAFLFAIWTGIVLSAVLREVPNDIVSQICNWLQLLSVCLMSTIVVVWLSLKKSFYSEDLLNSIGDIDKQFVAANLPLNYPKGIRYYWKWSTGIMVYLLLLICFDYYVWIWREVHNNMSLSYWLILFVPLVFNVLVVSQTILLISVVCDRFTIIRKVIKNIRFGRIVITKMYENLSLSSIDDQLRGQEESMELIHKVLHILNQLAGLCGKLNSYFSIVFVIVILSCFVVTLMQVYYAFLILFNLDDEHNRTLLEIITCVDMAVLQLALIIMLSSVCQRICVEAAKIMRIINSYHATQDLVGGDGMSSAIQVIITRFYLQAIINKSFNWLRLMIPHMKISAFGLCDINHNLLFGYIGTLITYLIILVQFYSLAGNVQLGVLKQTSDSIKLVPTETTDDSAPGPSSNLSDPSLIWSQ